MAVEWRPSGTMQRIGNNNNSSGAIGSKSLRLALRPGTKDGRRLCSSSNNRNRIGRAGDSRRQTRPPRHRRGNGRVMVVQRREARQERHRVREQRQDRLPDTGTDISGRINQGFEFARTTTKWYNVIVDGQGQKRKRKKNFICILTCREEHFR